MKKLPLIIAALFSVSAYADCDFDATQPQIELLDENKQPVDGVSKSNSALKAGAKSSKFCPSDVCYGRYIGDIKFTYYCDDPIEPTPEPDPVTEAECAEQGMIPNGTLTGCIVAPQPTCEDPLVFKPNPDNPFRTGSCGCEDVGDNYNADTNTCEPHSMSGNPNDGTTLPAVDLSLQPAPAVGQSVINIGTALSGYVPHSKAGTNEGDFRLNCGFSHMNNDDPIVYPNQEAAAHHHTFFGNTTTNYKSDVGNMKNVGNSTCNGGIANRSAYWVPSMIDTSTNTPLKPDGIGVYYKTQRASDVTVPPEGLRIIAKNFTKTDFMCNENYGTRAEDRIVDCHQGGQVRYGVNFPNCWDGVNLDSPDHMSHMAYAVWNDACPASHPKRIPNITINVFYNVTTPAGTANWRLSSDPLTSTTPGSTIHADWVNGWNQEIAERMTNNCLKGQLDCHADLLGDGTQMY